MKAPPPFQAPSPLKTILLLQVVWEAGAHGTASARRTGEKHCRVYPPGEDLSRFPLFKLP
jgi:hypothetical protein